MLALIARLFRLCCALLLAALILQWLAFPAAADELADFRLAIDDAAAQHRIALRTLETEGQRETAAAVHRFRQTWQQVIECYGLLQPPPGAGDGKLPALFLDVDMRIIGVLLVIDLGNRDAARNALAAIAGPITEVSETAAH